MKYFFAFLFFGDDGKDSVYLIMYAIIFGTHKYLARNRSQDRRIGASRDNGGEKK